jgi:hypothetical protein
VWAMELGLAAQFGHQQGLEIVDRDNALPSDAEATIALDRSMAIELARRYPRAKRLYKLQFFSAGQLIATLFPHR